MWLFSIQGQPSITAYITYCRPEDAMRAVLSLDQSNMQGRQLRVSLGTTKYCSQFLRGHKCTKHASHFIPILSFYRHRGRCITASLIKSRYIGHIACLIFALKIDCYGLRTLYMVPGAVVPSRDQ